MTSKRRALDTQNCGTNSRIYYSDDSSDSNSRGSDRGHLLKSNNLRKSASRSLPSRSRGGADEDDEYEVEQILEARVYYRKLQYRVKWLGYEDDPAWYNASNFKNSSRKLREFHEANPTVSGPPKRLSHWERCCEEDKDADDFSDDNEPRKIHRRGRRAVRLVRAAI
jgi:hypothetical protein